MAEEIINIVLGTAFSSLHGDSSTYNHFRQSIQLFAHIFFERTALSGSVGRVNPVAAHRQGTVFYRRKHLLTRGFKS